jgi:inosine-uridine nucleoside N-ribohydrolase
MVCLGAECAAPDPGAGDTAGDSGRVRPGQPAGRVPVVPAGLAGRRGRHVRSGLPGWRGAQPAESGVGLLVSTIRQSPRPVTLITLRPLTDVALALRAEPGIARNIAGIYAMAGAVRVPGNEPSHHFAEWNVYIDAAAAAAVLRSKVPVIFVPLDASDNVPITPFFRDAVQSHRGTAALRLCRLEDAFIARTCPSAPCDTLITDLGRSS